MKRVLLVLGGLAVAWIVAVVATFETVPRSNTDLQTFDTIIMLGAPADPDGKPSWEQRERVGEAVREFQHGRAAHLSVTGGAAHNQWVEAEVEAALARRLGVPAEDVLVECRSQNTMQNIANAWQIMQAHGWTSAEVVSNRSHLPRAATILVSYNKAGMLWRVHASPLAPEYHASYVVGRYVLEALATWEWRWFGLPKDSVRR